MKPELRLMLAVWRRLEGTPLHDKELSDAVRHLENSPADVPELYAAVFAAAYAFVFHGGDLAALRREFKMYCRDCVGASAPRPPVFPWQERADLK